MSTGALQRRWSRSNPILLDTILRDRINENATALAEGKVMQYPHVDLPRE